MRKIFWGVACSLLFVSGFVFAGETDIPREKYNVVIICLDTLRADHVGCYGYFRDTTPFIDKWAAGGAVFERAFSQSSFTLGSHVSLFTSRYVSAHRADRIERRLGDKETTLAEILKDNGYDTAAFTYNAALLDPQYGLNKGFDTYFYGIDKKDRTLSFVKTLPASLEWLDKHRDKRFFVFLHSNDIHEPYHSVYENFFDPGYKGRLDDEYFASGTPFHKNNFDRTPREYKHIVAHYDGGVKYADSFVGKFLDQLESWGLLKKTIVIVLSDHGEILADRGKRFCHGFSLHDEEVHVPLIISHPDIKNVHRISGLVQLIDVMPTVLDLLGINRENLALEGKSLVDLLEGRQKGELNRYVYAECLKGNSEREGIIDREFMVRTSSWKLIANTWRTTDIFKEPPSGMVQMHNFAIISTKGEEGYELYDLKADPEENRNLFSRGPLKIKAELLGRLVDSFE